jgi:hypothetical protein
MQINDEEWKKKFIQDIEEDLPTVLPDLIKTGIDDIDAKYKPREDKNLLGKLGNLKNIPGINFISGDDENKELDRTKPKKFKNYTNPEDVFEMPDLDSLITG